MSEGQKLEKKNIKTYPVGDKKVRGILLDEEGPPGVIQYSRLNTAGASMSTVLADSSEAVDDEVQTAWRSASKRLKLTPVQDKAKEGYILKAPAPKGGADSSEDDNIMDHIWGRRLSVGSLGGSGCGSNAHSTASADVVDGGPATKYG